MNESLKSEIKQFLERTAQTVLEPHIEKILGFYKAKFGLLTTINEIYLGKLSLLKVPFAKIASVINFLGLPQEHYYLFWIAKLYFVLPLPPGWTQSAVSLETVEYKFQDVTSVFHPVLIYLLYLKNAFLSDSMLLRSLKKTAALRRVNLFHFALEEGSQPGIRQLHLLKNYRKNESLANDSISNAKCSIVVQPNFLLKQSLKN